MLGKNRLKSAKIRFLYLHVYIVTKKWGKKAGNNFSRKTRIEMLGKKSSQKVRKHVFYIHTNITNKKWGKNARNNFSRNARIERGKNVGEKVSKKCGKSFFIFTRIS